MTDPRSGYQQQGALKGAQFKETFGVTGSGNYGGGRGGFYNKAGRGG